LNTRLIKYTYYNKQYLIHTKVYMNNTRIDKYIMLYIAKSLDLSPKSITYSLIYSYSIYKIYKNSCAKKLKNLGFV